MAGSRPSPASTLESRWIDRTSIDLIVGAGAVSAPLFLLAAAPSLAAAQALFPPASTR